MKILVVRSSNPFTKPSASNNRFLSLAEGLVANDCKVDMVFTSAIIDELEIKSFGYSGSYKGLGYQYLIPHNCTNRFKRQILLRSLYSNYFLSKKITILISKNKYDFVWLAFSPTVIKLGLRLFNSNNLSTKFFHEQSEFSWIGLKGDKKLHKKYLTEFLSGINLMSVMTKTLEEYYKKYLNPQAEMVHLPMTVDLARFENVKVDKILSKPYIAYCGTMNNQKDGVDILIQSFIKIKDDFPELHLYLAGPLKPEKDYAQQKEIIKNAKAENRITYLGMLSVEEMPIFLSNAKVLALARPESKQAEGGFPTKLGEYLATGNPVCVTKVGEIPNYLTDKESAYLAEPGSVESFTSNLKLVLTSLNATKVGNAGKEVAYNHFNKQKQAQLLYNFLQNNLS